MVVATLAAVEDPKAEFYMSVETDVNDTKKGNGQAGENLLLAQPKPITSKLKTTIKHLRERAGPWSRFRGLRAYLVFAFLRDVLVSCVTFGTVYRPTMINSLAHVFAEVALAQIGMAWVHIVISEPSPKSWYKRVPGFRTWVKILPAALVASVGSRVTFFAPMVLSSSFSLTGEYNSGQSVFAGLAVIGLGLALAVLIEVPAVVTFIRVAASMLPEEDEAIVPFDRTFGGKVTPAVVGGSGKIGLIDAWKSFNWASRFRFIMVAVKTMAMQVGLVIFFAAVFVGEMVLITGTYSPEKLRDILGLPKP
jgi:hypothetical protein